MARSALVTAAAVLLGVVIGVQISLRWRPTVHATDQVLTDEKVVLAALGAQSKNKAPEQALGSRVRSPKPSTRGELVPGFGEYLDASMGSMGGTSGRQQTFEVVTEAQERFGDVHHDTGASKMKSSHTCYGRDYQNDHWHRTTCLYNNVCYDTANNEFVYVAHDENERQHVEESEDLHTSYFPVGAVQHPHEEEYRFKPRVVTSESFQTLVAEAGGVHMLSNLHVVYGSYNAENFGHFLTDELLPGFSAMEAFGELNYDVQFLQVSPKTKYQFSCEWQRDNWGYEQWEKCLHRYKSMTHLLSRNTVQFLGNYTRKIARKMGQERPICFRKMIVGYGMLADHCEDKAMHGRSDVSNLCNQGRQQTLWGFRHYTMRALGLDPNKYVPKKRVLIWDRNANDYKKQRKIHGLAELAKRIEKELGVECMIYEQWIDKTLKYQIQTMAESTVFITGPGSGSHIGWYLPRGSTMIRLYPELWHMEWHLFNYMSHMQVEHVRATDGSFDEDKVFELARAGLERFDLYHLDKSKSKSR